MSEISMNLQEQIAFCEEKSKNIKLKTEPQTFVDIKANLEKLEKIETLLFPTDMCNGQICSTCDYEGGTDCINERKLDLIEQIVKGE